MKWIKLFEYFDSDGITMNAKEILRRLEDFGYNVIVTSTQTNLNINISKKKGEEFKVFYNSDVLDTLEDCDKYLYLGEGLKAESIFIETLDGDKELTNINQISRERGGLLSIFITYVK